MLSADDRTPPTTAVDDRLVPRRSWFRFSLRTLLVLVLVSGCAAAWLGAKLNRAREQRQAVLEAQQVRMTVKYDYQYDEQFPGGWNMQIEPASPMWLRRLLGDECFGEVECIFSLNNGGLTNDDLAVIARFPKLRRLYLWGPQVTDDGLIHLQDLSELEVLFLATNATDEGLENLAGLSKLDWLLLGGPQNGGTLYLRDVPSPHDEPAYDGNVSRDGALRLQQALPNTNIVY